jgi:pimeloyl-ACP methyl ester carboxylesterase
MRVLALHGYTQNGNIMRKQLGFFQNHHKEIDFFFPDAPHAVEGDGDSKHAWYRFTEEPNVNYLGLAKTVRFLEDYKTHHGPFDGVIGFSQGAILATMLCALEAHRNLQTIPDQVGTSPNSSPNSQVDEMNVPCTSLPPISLGFRFGIFIGGGPPRDISFSQAYSNPILSHSLPRIPLPSLHVYGEADSIIPPEKSQILANLYENPQLFRHPKGHIVPGWKEAENIYNSFLNKFKK